MASGRSSEDTLIAGELRREVYSMMASLFLVATLCLEPLSTMGKLGDEVRNDDCWCMRNSGVDCALLEVLSEIDAPDRFVPLDTVPLYMLHPMRTRFRKLWGIWVRLSNLAPLSTKQHFCTFVSLILKQ